jgi:outer membrane protein assembly factor BamD (BamD/ComL family)
VLLAAAFVLFVVPPSIHAQGVRSGPDPSTFRDPDLERDSHHNLEVAKNYFKLKKAYVAALKRCEEIIAGNPNFAKIEEVLLMAGQSSVWLSEAKGKQNPNLYVTFVDGEKKTLTPEEFREMGRDYLKKLVELYPNGEYAKQAQEELNRLPASKPK